MYAQVRHELACSRIVVESLGCCPDVAGPWPGPWLHARHPLLQIRFAAFLHERQTLLAVVFGSLRPSQAINRGYREIVRVVFGSGGHTACRRVCSPIQSEICRRTLSVVFNFIGIQ